MFIFLCGLCVLGGERFNPCLAEEPLANENLQGLYVRSIEQTLRLPPEQIDLGIAALIVSESWSNGVSGRRYQQQLDDMAIEIRNRLKEKDIPVGIGAIPVINNYLFEEMKFSTIDKADDPYDLFLHSVIDRRRGYCLSLSILYLAIGERLGLPLYGVVVPGHFFVRYDDGKIRFNIETTSKGQSAGDDEYIKKFNVPRDNAAIYMTNLNKMQTLGCFFNNLGNVYHETGNIDQAMAALQWAVYINPSLAESRLNLGNIYMQKERIDDAIAEYQAAARINPKDAMVHNNLGSAYQKKQWFNDAVSEYTSSIRLEPNNVNTYRNLASTYCKLSQFAEARTTLVQAINIEPKNPVLFCELGDIYVQSGRSDEAISRYEKALSLKPDYAEAYFGLGCSYNKLGQPDNEIKSYLKALEIKPDMISAILNLANAYFAKSDYDAAIEYYIKGIKVAPADARFYYNLGAAYANKGSLEQAYSAYSKAAELDPKMAEAHLGLAIVSYHLKNYDKAEKHLRTAQELGATIDPNLASAIERKK